MNTTVHQNHTYADPLLHPVRSCLQKRDQPPRTVGITSCKYTSSTLVINDPHWGERASVALDVFDGSIRRAEALLAELHRNGYDTTVVSTRLRDIQRSRGSIAHALSTHRTDLLAQFRCELCMSMHDLCYDILTLKRHTRTHPQENANVSIKPKEIPLIWMDGDLHNRSLSPQKCVAERLPA